MKSINTLDRLQIKKMLESRGVPYTEQNVQDMYALIEKARAPIRRKSRRLFYCCKCKEEYYCSQMIHVQLCRGSNIDLIVGTLDSPSKESMKHYSQISKEEKELRRLD